jgi:hypothetical protein
MDITKPHTRRDRILWFVGIYLASLTISVLTVYALRLLIRL